MIVARGEGKQGGFILLGLSDMNIEKLKEGKPIFKSKEEVGLPVNLIIVHGKTEDHILEQLSTHFDPLEVS